MHEQGGKEKEVPTSVEGIDGIEIRQHRCVGSEGSEGTQSRYICFSEGAGQQPRAVPQQAGQPPRSRSNQARVSHEDGAAAHSTPVRPPRVDSSHASTLRQPLPPELRVGFPRSPTTARREGRRTHLAHELAVDLEAVRVFLIVLLNHPRRHTLRVGRLGEHIEEGQAATLVAKGGNAGPQLRIARLP